MSGKANEYCCPLCENYNEEEGNRAWQQREEEFTIYGDDEPDPFEVLSSDLGNDDQTRYIDGKTFWRRKGHF